MLCGKPAALERCHWLGMLGYADSLQQTSRHGTTYDKRERLASRRLTRSQQPASGHWFDVGLQGGRGVEVRVGQRGRRASQSLPSALTMYIFRQEGPLEPVLSSTAGARMTCRAWA
jgi:hypothetical protein